MPFPLSLSLFPFASDSRLSVGSPPVGERNGVFTRPAGLAVSDPHCSAFFQLGDAFVMEGTEVA